jgi:hypothetical protein
MSRPSANIDALAAELPDIPREWLEEFEAAARRPLEQRFRYAFIKTMNRFEHSIRRPITVAGAKKTFQAG